MILPNVPRGVILLFLLLDMNCVLSYINWRWTIMRMGSTCSPVRVILLNVHGVLFLLFLLLDVNCVLSHIYWDGRLFMSRFMSSRNVLNELDNFRPLLYE